MMMRLFSAVLLIFCLQNTVLALDPSEVLQDPQQESRARELSGELRCLVCQNQSIDDSDAELARDLRRLVRERIKAGDSNDQVRGFLVDRYGEFILLKPTFSFRNALLWGMPFLALFIGIMVLRNSFRRPAHPLTEGVVELTEEEKHALEDVLKRGA